MATTTIIFANTTVLMTVVTEDRRATELLNCLLLLNDLVPQWSLEKVRGIRPSSGKTVRVSHGAYIQLTSPCSLIFFPLSHPRTNSNFFP